MKGGAIQEPLPHTEFQINCQPPSTYFCPGWLVVVLEVNINLITEVWIRVKLEKNHKGHCNCRVQLICSNCTQANDCNVIVADSYFIILGYTFGTTIVEKTRNRRDQLGHSLETPCWCRTLLRSLWLFSTCPLSLGQVPSLQLVHGGWMMAA